MKIFEGTGVTPVVYSVHHASHSFGLFSDRVALTSEQQVRFSDYGSAETVPRNGFRSIIANTSRGLVDLNRPLQHAELFPKVDFARPANSVWQADQALSESEKLFNIEAIYKPYHQAIIDLIKRIDSPDIFVVAWDNTAHYEIGKDPNNEPIIMKPIILSNFGDEGTATSDSGKVSCDPVFLELLADNLRVQLERNNLPSDVYLNLVFKGGEVANIYNSRRNDSLKQIGVTANVHSFQVEYNTSITHDQTTLEPSEENMQKLRSSFEQAMINSCKTYLL